MILFFHCLRKFSFSWEDINIKQSRLCITNDISKHLEVCQKDSGMPQIFKYLLSVQKSGRTESVMFDININWVTASGAGVGKGKKICHALYVMTETNQFFFIYISN